MKNNIIKIAKQLIKNDSKDELYSLFSICKSANIDISKDIDYEYKEKYENSKVLMITLKIKDYKTTDKYVEDYIRCYIEIDNMVSEGIESVATIQIKHEDASSMKNKILETIKEMKLEILREIISDAIEESIDPVKFLKDFKILYHYTEDTMKHIKDFKDEIEKDLDQKEFDKLKKEVIEEQKEFDDIISNINMEDL